MFISLYFCTSSLLFSISAATCLIESQRIPSTSPLAAASVLSPGFGDVGTFCTEQSPQNRTAVVPSTKISPMWGPQLTGMNISLAPKPAAPTFGAMQGAQPARIRLAGALLKQSPNMLHRWRIRHVEVGSGKMRWWNTLREKEEGRAPKNEVDLQGLTIQQRSATCFQVQTPSSLAAGRFYVLDANVKPSWIQHDATHWCQLHDSSRWIYALQQESIIGAVLARPLSQPSIHADRWEEYVPISPQTQASQWEEYGPPRGRADPGRDVANGSKLVWW